MSSFRWVIPDRRISRVIPKTIGMQKVLWAEAMESLFLCVGLRVQEIVRIGHSRESHECIWVHLCGYFSVNNLQIPISGEKVAKFLCGRNPQLYLLWFSQWFYFHLDNYASNMEGLSLPRGVSLSRSSPRANIGSKMELTIKRSLFLCRMLHTMGFIFWRL